MENNTTSDVDVEVVAVLETVILEFVLMLLQLPLLCVVEGEETH